MELSRHVTKFLIGLYEKLHQVLLQCSLVLWLIDTWTENDSSGCTCDRFAHRLRTGWFTWWYPQNLHSGRWRGGGSHGGGSRSFLSFCLTAPAESSDPVVISFNCWLSVWPLCRYLLLSVNSDRWHTKPFTDFVISDLKDQTIMQNLVRCNSVVSSCLQSCVTQSWMWQCSRLPLVYDHWNNIFHKWFGCEIHRRHNQRRSCLRFFGIRHLFGRLAKYKMDATTLNWLICPQFTYQLRF